MKRAKRTTKTSASTTDPAQNDPGLILFPLNEFDAAKAVPSTTPKPAPTRTRSRKTTAPVQPSATAPAPTFVKPAATTTRRAPTPSRTTTQQPGSSRPQSPIQPYFKPTKNSRTIIYIVGIWIFAGFIYLLTSGRNPVTDLITYMEEVFSSGPSEADFNSFKLQKILYDTEEVYDGGFHTFNKGKNYKGVLVLLEPTSSSQKTVVLPKGVWMSSKGSWRKGKLSEEKQKVIIAEDQLKKLISGKQPITGSVLIQEETEGDFYSVQANQLEFYYSIGIEFIENDFNAFKNNRKDTLYLPVHVYQLLRADESVTYLDLDDIPTQKLSAIKQESVSSAVLHTTAEKLYNARKYKEAEEAYSELLRRNPRDIKAMAGRGRSLNLIGKFKFARADFQDIISFIDIKKMNEFEKWYLHEAYSFRGVLFQKEMMYDKAVESFDQAIEINAKNPYTYYLRGLCYKETFSEENACKDFEKAFSLGLKEARIHLCKDE